MGNEAGTSTPNHLCVINWLTIWKKILMILLDPLLKKYTKKKKIPGRIQLIHSQTFKTQEKIEIDIHQMGKDILNSKAVRGGWEITKVKTDRFDSGKTAFTETLK